MTVMMMMMMITGIICLRIIISCENVMRVWSANTRISVESLTQMAVTIYLSVSEKKYNEFCFYGRIFYNVHSKVIACVSKWSARRSAMVHISSKWKVPALNAFPNNFSEHNRSHICSSNTKSRQRTRPLIFHRNGARKLRRKQNFRPIS